MNVRIKDEILRLLLFLQIVVTFGQHQQHQVT